MCHTMSHRLNILHPENIPFPSIELTDASSNSPDSFCFMNSHSISFLLFLFTPILLCLLFTRWQRMTIGIRSLTEWTDTFWSSVILILFSSISSQFYSNIIQHTGRYCWSDWVAARSWIGCQEVRRWGGGILSPPAITMAWVSGDLVWKGCRNFGTRISATWLTIRRMIQWNPASKETGCNSWLTWNHRFYHQIE